MQKNRDFYPQRLDISLSIHPQVLCLGCPVRGQTSIPATIVKHFLPAPSVSAWCSRLEMNGWQTITRVWRKDFYLEKKNHEFVRSREFTEWEKHPKRSLRNSLKSDKWTILLIIWPIKWGWYKIDTFTWKKAFGN